MDIWFRTLYLVYGLGLGTPKLISCRVFGSEIQGIRKLVLLINCIHIN